MRMDIASQKQMMIFIPFAVSTAAGATGNGGGGYVSAGPTTLSA